MSEEKLAGIVAAVRQTGSRRAAAERCGVSRSTVNRALLGEVIPAPTPETPATAGSARHCILAALLQHERPDPMAVAKAAWGFALDTSGACLKLNGRPVTFFDLMRRTNAALREEGLPVMRAFE